MAGQDHGNGGRLDRRRRLVADVGNCGEYCRGEARLAKPLDAVREVSWRAPRAAVGGAKSSPVAPSAITH